MVINHRVQTIGYKMSFLMHRLFCTYYQRARYGTAGVYAESVRKASMERMAKLVKIVGMLLTIVY
jgi:hypothetical protein